MYVSKWPCIFKEDACWNFATQAPVVRKTISANPRLNHPNPRSNFILLLNSVHRSSISTHYPRIKLRAQWYGLGYPRQPSPRATLAEVTFSLFLSKIQPAVYIRIANSSRGARQLGWASCRRLTSAGRVTLASGTTFLHINALARLTGTSLGVANVT